MTEEEDEHNVTNDLEEGTSTVKSTPAKPILDETWSQVEELPDPDDSDYTDEEVEYVALDLGADFPKDMLKRIDSIQVTKLNSSEPWIRVGPHIMHGRYERMLGSDLLLEFPSTDADSSKSEEVLPLATTQCRIRFEQVGLHAKSYGNPKVRLQNASSYLAPKVPKTNIEGSGRGRGRGGNRRGRAKPTDNNKSTPRDTREGSTNSSAIAEEERDETARSLDNEAVGDDQHMHGPEDTPAIEEF